MIKTNKKKVFKIIHSIYYYYHCLIIAHNVLIPIKFQWSFNGILKIKLI